MSRYLRILVAAVALVLLVAGAALASPGEKGLEHRSPVAASHQPSDPDDGDTEKTEDADVEPADTDGGGPSEDALQRIVDRLADREIDTDTETLAELAAKYGVGGALRIVTWADALEMSPDEVAALRDEMGWGKLVQELNAEHDTHLSPGNGWVMGHGNGLDKDHPHGPADAPGHNKD